MKFGFVKFGICRLLFASFIVIGLLGSDGASQDLDIFSGRGIPSNLQRQVQQAEPNRLSTPSIKNFLTDEVSPSAVRNPFSGLLKKPKLPTWDELKSKPTAENLDRSSSLSELLSKPDTSRLNLFQKMNSKSKDFFEKTKGWAKSKGSDTREKSSETWNNVIRDFKANKAKLIEHATIPVQPNFRSAEAIGEPKLRF